MRIEQATDNFDQYLRLRTEVFVKEQGVPAMREIDEFDTLEAKLVTHFVCIDGDEVVGTIRIHFPEDGAKTPTIYLQRITVRKDHRGLGVGAAMIRFAERHAANNVVEEGTDQIRFEIGGQVDKVGFYGLYGYEVYGEPYVDGGIDHRHLTKTVSIESLTQPCEYTLDYDWLWPHKRATEIAKLRVYVHLPVPGEAAKLVDAFAKSLPADENGVRGWGGWCVAEAKTPIETESAIEIISAGEDVADSIQDGAESLFDAAQKKDALLYYVQLPR